MRPRGAVGGAGGPRAAVVTCQHPFAMNRRTFLGQAGLALAGFGLGGCATTSRLRGRNVQAAIEFFDAMRVGRAQGGRPARTGFRPQTAS